MEICVSILLELGQTGYTSTVNVLSVRVTGR